MARNIVKNRRRIRVGKGFSIYTASEQADIVLLFLRQHPKGVLVREIREHTGAATNTITKRLKQLEDMGLAGHRNMLKFYDKVVKLYYAREKIKSKNENSNA